MSGVIEAIPAGIRKPANANSALADLLSIITQLSLPVIYNLEAVTKERTY